MVRSAPTPRYALVTRGPTARSAIVARGLTARRDLFGVIASWTLLLLALLGAALMGTTPASAQDVNAVPDVLEDVRVVSVDTDQAAFLLRFSPQEPRATPIEVDPTQPAVLLPQTLRAPRIALTTSLRGKGLVSGYRFEQRRGDLIFTLMTNAPARAVVEPAGNTSLQVRVTRLTGAEAIGARPVGSTGDPVVKASELGPAPLVGAGDAFEMVPLKYADVSEVVGLLLDGVTAEPNNVFIRREPGFGSPGSQQQSVYGLQRSEESRPKVPQGQSFGNGIGIDRRLNAIWVTGSRERIDQVRAQIAAIDVPVDSVILETQFVELTEQGARNLGIDLNNSAGQIGTGTLQTGTFNPFNVDPRTILPSAALQAAIYAQVQKGEGRIISRPRVAAQSGATAKIITGDALPILTAITLSGVNGVSQQVQYVNVGVTLQIAPRVSSDGFVTSNIYGVVSSVTGYSQGYPTISQREAETSVSVRDGETFVIGGLTQENVLTSKSKVPLLGDIPLVGSAFRVEKTTRAKTELYIVITPRIVRHRQLEGARDTGPVPPIDAAPGPMPIQP